jgi:hypothetical protein
MNPNVLLMTLVIAFEPIPILGGVLLLTAKRGRPKAVAFALGWALALAIIGFAIVLIGGQVSTPSGSTSSKASAVLDIVLGLALVVVAMRTRAKAHQPGGVATPGWMKRIDTMSPIAAFVLGMFLPPYLIAAAVGNDIVRENLSTTARVVAMALYVVVGSLGILIPILVTVIRPKSSDAVLASWRSWLEANWQMLVFWLLLGIGIYLALKGIIELAH